MSTLLVPACAPGPLRPDPQLGPPSTEVAQSVDALALQLAHGWKVGAPPSGTGARALSGLDGASITDITGTAGWRLTMENLAAALAPSQPSLAPYYVPILFESLRGARAAGLRAAIAPIHDREMEIAYARGLAMRALFEGMAWPRDTALIVDTDGPQSVAFAAALADRFDPVFNFGDWPHPLGVVPSQRTLAAALYYRPLFEAARRVRSPEAPPMWVLDADRLRPLADANRQFDNRYFVRLPDAARLAALGIRHVLYVDADGSPEADDLNAAFVDLCRHGFDLKLVALSDFPVDNQAEADAEPTDKDDGTDGAEVTWYEADLAPFWRYCDFYPAMIAGSGGRPVRWRAPHGVVIGPPTGRRMQAHADSRWPRPRPTLFTLQNALGPDHFTPLRPAGFGRVEIHTGAGGRLAGVRPGLSGSFVALGQRIERQRQARLEEAAAENGLVLQTDGGRRFAITNSPKGAPFFFRAVALSRSYGAGIDFASVRSSGGVSVAVGTRSSGSYSSGGSHSSGGSAGSFSASRGGGMMHR